MPIHSQLKELSKIKEQGGKEQSNPLHTHKTILSTAQYTKTSDETFSQQFNRLPKNKTLVIDYFQLYSITAVPDSTTTPPITSPDFTHGHNTPNRARQTPIKSEMERRRRILRKWTKCSDWSKSLQGTGFPLPGFR